MTQQREFDGGEAGGQALDAARFREIYEVSPDIIFLVSEDGLVADANPAFSALTGLNWAPPARLRAEELVKEDLRHDFVVAMAAARSGRRPARFATVFVTPDGAGLPVEGDFYPGRDRRVQGVFRVACPQRLAADSRARKMDALSRLAGGIAHDINNMLGAIEGYATLGLRKLPENDQLWSDLNEIRRAVVKISGLTRQLLLFGRRQTAQEGTVEVCGLLDDLSAALAGALGGGVTAEFSAQDGLPEVAGDGSQLLLALQNIALNARDAMPGGGVIKVKAALVPVGAGEVKADQPGPFPDKYVRISVSDLGAGIPRENLELIFDPFFTTKERGKGPGLGLSVAYGIVRRHKGWIEVDSEPGKGAEFSVFLPPASRPAVRAEAAAKGAAPGCSTGRVLVIEDDEALLNMACRALSESGCQVLKARGMAEALALLRRPGPAVEVIFSDIMLHDGKATDRADEMLELAPGACLIFCSGYAQPEEVMRFISGRGYQFLLKPYAIDSLVAAVADCFRK